MKKIGVIVARFQVPTLHAGHVQLLSDIAKRADKVIVFLGHKTHQPDLKNPYPLKVRKGMLKQVIEKHNFSNIVIDTIEDHPISNEGWSDDLDSKITLHVEKEGVDVEVTLYGSRDSFINYYTGRHKTEVVEEKIIASGTEMRNRILSLTEDELTDLHREGMVYGLKAVYPVGMSVVDVVVYRKSYSGYEYLLARKPRENVFRMIGGFFDVTQDESLEEAALRELKEEAGDIEVQEPIYLMSEKMEDWRYNDNQHKIVSSFFAMEYVSGTPIPNDDIEELRWMTEDETRKNLIADNHKNLLEKIITYTSSLK